MSPGGSTGEWAEGLQTGVPDTPGCPGGGPGGGGGGGGGGASRPPGHPGKGGGGDPLLLSPFSHTADSGVIASREAEGGAPPRRRRPCPKCNRRFTTVEEAVLA